MPPEHHHIIFLKKIEGQALFSLAFLLENPVWALPFHPISMIQWVSPAKNLLLNGGFAQNI